MANPSISWSDAQVSAFVEGRLDAQEAARFSAQVQRDLALAERVARQRALRRQGADGTGAAAGAAAGAPAGTGAQAAAAPPARALPSRWWWAGAAAAVLFATWAGTRLPRQDDAPIVTGANGVMAAGPLAEALATRGFVDGSTDEGVLISLSFRAGDGRYCRTFSLDIGIDGLACRNAAGWQVEAIGRSPDADARSDTAVRQASSGMSPSVVAAIARWQAGDALTPEEERRVRERDWR
jgi:hypothetical protein